MNKKNSQLTIRLPDELLDLLRELAQEDKRSLNAYIGIALQEYADAKLAEKREAVE